MFANDLMSVTHIFYSCSRPKGKSYLFFTQFKVELKGAKIEYANAYVSIKETHLLVKHIAQPIYTNLLVCLSSDPCPPPGTLITLVR